MVCRWLAKGKYVGRHLLKDNVCSTLVDLHGDLTVGVDHVVGISVLGEDIYVISHVLAARGRSVFRNCRLLILLGNATRHESVLGSVLRIVVAYGRGVILIEGCLVNANVWVACHGIVGGLGNSTAIANGNVAGLIAIIGLIVILRILEGDTVDNIYDDRILFVTEGRLDDGNALAKCYEVAPINADTAVAGRPDNLVRAADQGQLMALAKVKVECNAVLNVELAAFNGRLVGSTKDEVATHRIE